MGSTEKRSASRHSRSQLIRRDADLDRRHPERIRELSNPDREALTKLTRKE
jgi:hypothetical protein